MANENDLSGKVSLDITDVKANISALNQQIRVIDTGFRAAAAGMADWGSNADGLQSRITALTNIIDLQRQKVDNLKELYSKVAAEQGQSSKAAQDLQIRINNETAALNKNQLELNSTVEKLDNLGKQSDNTGADIKELGNDLETSGKKALSFGDVLKANIASEAIVGGVKALGSAVKAVANEVGELASAAMDTADNVQKLSDETGLDVEKLQEMKYIGDDLGVSLETQTGALSKLIKNMAGAKDGTGTAADAFKTLGISVVDSNGNLRDSNIVYAEALDALGKIDNETEATALAQQILGKSAMELNPLIKAGSAGLAEMAAEAKASGAIMAGETVADLDSLGDTVDHLKQSAQSAAGSFLAHFAPALKDVATSFAGVISGAGNVDEFIGKIGALTTKVTSTITAKIPELMKTGSTILLSIVSGIAASLPELATSAISVIMQFITTLISMLPQLVDTGLQAVIQFALGIANALPQLIPTIVDVMMKIVQTIIDNLPQLIDAGLKILQGLIQGIINAIPVLVAALPQIINSIITVVLGAIPQIIQAGISLLTALVGALPQIIAAIVDALPQIIDGILNGILTAIPQIIDAGINLLIALIGALPQIITTIVAALPKIINGIVNGLIGNIDKIILGGVQLFVALVENLPAIIAGIVKAIPEIIQAITGAFGQFFSTMANTGLNLIKGLWQGISDAAGWLWDKISGFFAGIVTRIKDFFGIASPARKIWPGLGSNMAKGLGAGFVGAMGGVSDQITKSIPTNFEMTGQYKTSTQMSENIVNALAPFLGNQGGENFEIKIVLPDGTPLANFLFDPLLGVAQQRGVALG